MAFQIKKFNSIVASMINWVSNATNRITDFNIGSVSRTILEAVAMELEELYYQLLRAVQEAIEEAIYRAFDFPRNPAEKATGSVKVTRQSGSDAVIIIPIGSLFSTTSEPPVYFETQSEERLESLQGVATGGNSVSLIDNRDWYTDLKILPSSPLPTIKVVNVTDSGESYVTSIDSTGEHGAWNDRLNIFPLSGGASFEKLFSRVFYYMATPPTWVEWTTQARYDDGIYFPVGLIATPSDYLYFGADSPFDGFDVYAGSSPNEVASGLFGEYWNGSAWTQLPYFIDNTQGDPKNGIPFSYDGSIVWRIPNDWIRKIEQTYNLYWIRIKAFDNLVGLVGTANPAVTTTNLTLTDTRLAMVVDQYVGAVITCNGKTMIIADNNATSFNSQIMSGTATDGAANKLIDSTKDFVSEGVVVGNRIVKTADGKTAVVSNIATTVNANDTLIFVASLVTPVFSNGNAYTIDTGGWSPPPNPGNGFAWSLTPNVDATQFDGDAYKVIIMDKEISVQAMNAGLSGNVQANSITVIRSSLPYLTSVNNISAFSSGREEETDLERKGRFALYIQSLARATRGALEYAARTVPQIVAAKAIDDVRPVVLKGRTYPLVLWSDISAQMWNPGDPPVSLFESSQNDEDALYIGAKELFDYVNMHLAVPGVVVTPNLIWEYYSVDGFWKTLTVTDETDPGTGSLQQNGTISFTPPTDWTSLLLPPEGEAGFTYLRMWIRLRIQFPGSTYSPVPRGDWCSLPPGFGYVYLYCHDGSGELNDSLKISVENAVELYRGCGITVEVKSPLKVTPTITVSLLIQANYDPVDIAGKVRQALIDYLNTKVLGEDLFLAELYQFIMDTYDKAILNVSITEPTADIYISSSSVVRANPSVITVTGTTV